MGKTKHDVERERSVVYEALKRVCEQAKQRMIDA
jgi:hypothetical protein